jgi:hypothetical protein
MIAGRRGKEDEGFGIGSEKVYQRVCYVGCRLY